MPAAPATQPRPKMGVRLTLVGKGMRLMRRASMVGLAMPVTEAKKMAEMSAAVRPTRARARVMAFSPSSTAASIQASLVGPKPERLG